ncbi:MAG: aromatic ring-hydroxylating dioxygenase subunit alpha [Pseudomonadota bacterium]
MQLIQQVQEVAVSPLGVAEALPFKAFHDAEYFSVELARVFKEDWVFVCMDADLAKPGDYQGLNIAGEAIVVLRTKEGSLRALSNVCRHRGVVMLQGAGNLATGKLVCPYHAWTYEDDGTLRAVPHTGSVEVRKEEHCLPSFRVESWHGFVFVTLNDDAPPLAQRFRGLEMHLEPYATDSFSHALPTSTSVWNANWKLAIENFVEGYHFFAVHKNTVETAASTRDCFYVDGNADWSVTGGKQAGYPTDILGWIKGAATETHYLSIHMPPNLVINLYGGHLGWARVLPTEPDQVEVTTGYASARPLGQFMSGLGQRIFGSIDRKIFAEDQAICERAQKGVRSERSKGGQLVELERAVINFHQYLAKRLAGTDFNEKACPE